MATTWRSILGNQVGVGAGTAYASSSAATDVSPAPQVVIPANYLSVGQRLRITAYGIFSTTGTPTLLAGVYFGGVAGTLLAATAANATGNNAASWPWKIALDIYVRSVGSAGSVWCNGQFDLGSSLTAYTGYALPSSQTQPISSLNMTQSNILTVGMTWGTSSSSNTLTCEDAYVETLV